MTNSSTVSAACTKRHSHDGASILMRTCSDVIHFPLEEVRTQHTPTVLSLSIILFYGLISHL